MKHVSALCRLMTPELLTDKICRPLLSFNCFQEFVNRNANIKFGYKIVPSYENASFDSIFENDLSDIHRSDIVLDIGANAGAFSLLVSKFVNHVYAVEPLFPDLIRKNIELNNIKNITVLDCALGIGTLDVRYNRKRTMKGSTLGEIIEMCGEPINFLKCDCEGGEWSINQNDLRGIRRLEIEYHNVTKHIIAFTLNKLDEDFVCKVDKCFGDRMHLHADRKY